MRRNQPYCLRCIRYWGNCEEYIKPRQNKSSRRAPKSKISGVPQAPISIQPAPVYSMDQTRVVPLQDIPQSLTNIGPDFKDYEEDRMFNVFLNTTSPALSGAFNTHVWFYLLPQHAANQPFVRYGVAALGGMTAAIAEVMKSRMAGKFWRC
jgi:hypothetical protein